MISACQIYILEFLIPRLQGKVKEWADAKRIASQYCLITGRERRKSVESRMYKDFLTLPFSFSPFILLGEIYP
jgi:hypothetical protein